MAALFTDNVCHNVSAFLPGKVDLLKQVETVVPATWCWVNRCYACASTNAKAISESEQMEIGGIHLDLTCKGAVIVYADEAVFTSSTGY